MLLSLKKIKIAAITPTKRTAITDNSPYFTIQVEMLSEKCSL